MILGKPYNLFYQVKSNLFLHKQLYEEKLNDTFAHFA